MPVAAGSPGLSSTWTSYEFEAGVFGVQPLTRGHSKAKSLTVNFQMPGSKPPRSAVCSNEKLVFGSVIMPLNGEDPP